MVLSSPPVLQHAILPVWQSVAASDNRPLLCPCPQAKPEIRDSVRTVVSFRPVTRLSTVGAAAAAAGGIRVGYTVGMKGAGCTDGVPKL